METRPGHLAWLDLSVDDAPALRDFYAEVVGWRAEEVPMGDYADFTMTDAEGTPIAGVCHARGPNADLPPIWMIYLAVADLDASLEAVARGGGEVLGAVRTMGGWRTAVIRDPAGAVLTIGERAAG